MKRSPFFILQIFALLIGILLSISHPLWLSDAALALLLVIVAPFIFRRPRLEFPTSKTLFLLSTLAVAVGALWFGVSQNLQLSLLKSIGLVLIVLPFGKSKENTVLTSKDGLHLIEHILFDHEAWVQGEATQLHAIKSIDPKISEWALLQRLASLDHEGSHPIALALKQTAKAKRLELLETTQVKRTADGLSGLVSGRRMLIGSASFLKKEGVSPGPLESLAAELVKQGYLVSLVATEGRATGLVSVLNPVRPELKMLLEALKKQGRRCVLLQQKDDPAPEQLLPQFGFDERHSGVNEEKRATLIHALGSTKTLDLRRWDHDPLQLPEALLKAKHDQTHEQKNEKLVRLYHLVAFLAVMIFPLPLSLSALGPWCFRRFAPSSNKFSPTDAKR